MLISDNFDFVVILFTFFFCRLPFLKQKMSDETVYAQIAIESISQLGYLMRVSDPQVRSALVDAIVSFYCEEPELGDFLEVC